MIESFCLKKLKGMKGNRGSNERVEERFDKIRKSKIVNVNLKGY